MRRSSCFIVFVLDVGIACKLATSISGLAELIRFACLENEVLLFFQWFLVILRVVSIHTKLCVSVGCGGTKADPQPKLQAQSKG